MLKKEAKNFRLQRYFTRGLNDPYSQISWEKRQIKDQGKVYEVEVPSFWSMRATEILTHFYLRKGGVQTTEGCESSLKQVIDRVVSTLKSYAESLGNYFLDDEESQVFVDELKFILAHQMAAFNSPTWFNLGLRQAYGICGKPGFYYWNPQSQQVEPCEDNYEHPQCASTFILSIQDDFSSLFDFAKSEALIFRYGSGTGSNFSSLRSIQEEIKGGGHPPGLVPFLEVFDRIAGLAKMGGVTRRAAKMLCLDVDHPEILSFIDWKVHEEEKVRALVQEGYPKDFNGEAYHTIAGQNGNNSVRVNDAFMTAVESDAEWKTYYRQSQQVCEVHSARSIFNKIVDAAWYCADPALQFETAIQRWNTCRNSGPIRASNSCSEFMFLDDTACHLASINLEKFLRADATWDIEGYRQVAALLIIAMDIMVDLDGYPTAKLAKNTHRFRPLGLGLASLGAVLMQLALPYDSDQARQLSAALVATLTGEAYWVSSVMAARKSSFEAYNENQDCMSEVLQEHQKAWHVMEKQYVSSDWVQAANDAWERALDAGNIYGYRNAQTTLMAPTGTIGLLMDCDTLGIEPEFSLVKLKKLQKGGHFKIVNNSFIQALKRLGYSETQIQDIGFYVCGNLSLKRAKVISWEALLQKGFHGEELEHLEKALPHAFSLTQVFSHHFLNHDCLQRFGFSPKQYKNSEFNLLEELGFDAQTIDRANDEICGRLTVEGAPHLKSEHLPVFDCANRCGVHSERYLSPWSHVQMMIALQPLLSGAISKTVNMPSESKVSDVQKVYWGAWKNGLKAISIYRDQCKLSQPLATSVPKDTIVEIVEVEIQKLRKKIKELERQKNALNQKNIMEFEESETDAARELHEQRFVSQ